MLAEVDRLEDRLAPVFGILVGLELLSDLALEFLLSGPKTSFIGDVNGDIESSTGFPSGIVCGGEIVVLLVRLPVLFSSPYVSVGDGGDTAPFSLLADTVDADVRDATCCAWRSLRSAVPW